MNAVKLEAKCLLMKVESNRSHLVSCRRQRELFVPITSFTHGENVGNSMGIAHQAKVAPSH